MAYSYQPRDPRAKLREIVTKYVASMRVAGRAPNRGVVFGEAPLSSSPPVQGWLVGDRRPGTGDARYLVLADGDVWRAKKDAAGADGVPSPALDAAVTAWLAQPDDDLVTLLARSLSDARMGGSGWLEEGVGVECVAERRRMQHGHGGPDRRRDG